MPHQASLPDFAIALDPDLRALDAACYCVGIMACPPADVRESVVLVTSALIAGAVGRRRPGPAPPIELRVWTHPDSVRVEIRGARDLLAWPEPPDRDDAARLMLEYVADRWAIGSDGQLALVWFEIDRPCGAPSPREPQPERFRIGAIRERRPSRRAPGSHGAGGRPARCDAFCVARAAEPRCAATGRRRRAP